MQWNAKTLATVEMLLSYKKPIPVDYARVLLGRLRKLQGEYEAVLAENIRLKWQITEASEEAAKQHRINDRIREEFSAALATAAGKDCIMEVRDE